MMWQQEITKRGWEEARRMIRDGDGLRAYIAAFFGCRDCRIMVVPGVDSDTMEFVKLHPLLCDWLRSEGLDPKDVPARSDAIHYKRGRAGVLIVERGEGGGAVAEDGELKMAREWVSVSSRPPTLEDVQE